MVRCKPGGEQAAVIKLMRKAIHFATLGNNLQVTSVVGFKQAKVYNAMTAYILTCINFDLKCRKKQ